MPDFLTPQVVAATGPVMVETLVKHYLTPRKERKDRHGQDTARVDLMYDEAFTIAKEFMDIATQHPVASLQSFSVTRTPAPPWVAVHRLRIPQSSLTQAATKLVEAFGGEDMAYKIAGGTKWWQVRAGKGVEAEWIAIKNNDYRLAVQEERVAQNQRMKEQEVKETTNEPHQDRRPLDKTDKTNKTDDGDAGFTPEMDQMRCMLFIHGGAYYWGSINTHRYVIWRLARKMKGRCFAVNYRKAPQYPFPCAIQDCLAAWMYLVNPPPDAPHRPVDPKNIILAGDSAGGALVWALLQILRDTPGLDLPAGAVLISPWSDLTHSFPSILENTETDVVPRYSFIHKPSSLWPPPPADLTEDVQSRIQKKVRTALHHLRHQTPGNDQSLTDEEIPDSALVEGSPSTNTDTTIYTSDPHVWTKFKPFFKKRTEVEAKSNASDGPTDMANPSEVFASLKQKDEGTPRRVGTLAQAAAPLHVNVGGQRVVIDTQIQLYATNAQLRHPFISPVLGYLGGLPPLYILAGNNEVLRDEVIYCAHKAAHPEQHPIADDVKQLLPSLQGVEDRYQPTNVHLQVYDGVGHDLPLFSMTRPSRGAFRAMATFCRYVTPKRDSNLDLGSTSLDSAAMPRRGSDPSPDTTPYYTPLTEMASFLAEKPSSMDNVNQKLEEVVAADGNGSATVGHLDVDVMEDTKVVESAEIVKASHIQDETTSASGKTSTTNSQKDNSDGSPSTSSIDRPPARVPLATPISLDHATRVEGEYMVPSDSDDEPQGEIFVVENAPRLTTPIADEGRVMEMARDDSGSFPGSDEDTNRREAAVIQERSGSQSDSDAPKSERLLVVDNDPVTRQPVKITQVDINEDVEHHQTVFSRHEDSQDDVNVEQPAPSHEHAEHSTTNSGPERQQKRKSRLSGIFSGRTNPSSPEIESRSPDTTLNDGPPRITISTGPELEKAREPPSGKPRRRWSAMFKSASERERDSDSKPSSPVQTRDLVASPVEMSPQTPTKRQTKIFGNRESTQNTTIAGKCGNRGSTQSSVAGGKDGERGEHKEKAKPGEAGYFGIYRGPNPFEDHMIRERVSLGGKLRPLEPASELAAMRMPASEIGMIKEGPAMRYVEGGAKWNHKFRRARKKVIRHRRRNLKESREKDQKRIIQRWETQMSAVAKQSKTTGSAASSVASKSERRRAKAASRHLEPPSQRFETPAQRVARQYTQERLESPSDSEAEGDGGDSSDTSEETPSFPHADTVDGSWAWEWALNDEAPPPSAIVSRRDLPEGRKLALLADRMESDPSELHSLSLWVIMASMFASSPRDRERAKSLAAQAKAEHKAGRERRKEAKRAKTEELLKKGHEESERRAQARVEEGSEKEGVRKDEDIIKDKVGTGDGGDGAVSQPAAMAGEDDQNGQVEASTTPEKTFKVISGVKSPKGAINPETTGAAITAGHPQTPPSGGKVKKRGVFGRLFHRH